MFQMSGEPWGEFTTKQQRHKHFFFEDLENIGMYYTWRFGVGKNRFQQNPCFLVVLGSVWDPSFSKGDFFLSRMNPAFTQVRFWDYLFLGASETMISYREKS